MSHDPWFDEQAAVHGAARDAWLAEWARCGGTQAELAPLFDVERPLRELMERGPCAYGPLPSGCSATGERRELHHSRVAGFRARRDRRLRPAEHAVAARLSRSRFDPAVGVRALPDILARLWQAEAHAAERYHPFWVEIDATEFTSDGYACLTYAWALAEGASPDPVLDACVQAVRAGRFPVGLIGGSVIAYAQEPDELTRLAADFSVKREAREARWR